MKQTNMLMERLAGMQLWTGVACLALLLLSTVLGASGGWIISAAFAVFGLCTLGLGFVMVNGSAKGLLPFERWALRLARRGGSTADTSHLEEYYRSDRYRKTMGWMNLASGALISLAGIFGLISG